MYYTPYFIGGEYHNWTVYFFLIYELHRILRLVNNIICIINRQVIILISRPQVLLVVVYLSVRSFFLQISDTRIGGTYMSLLNTVWYLGIAVSRIAALGMLNLLTIKQCSADLANECRFKTANDEVNNIFILILYNTKLFIFI